MDLSADTPPEELPSYQSEHDRAPSAGRTETGFTPEEQQGSSSPPQNDTPCSPQETPVGDTPMQGDEEQEKTSPQEEGGPPTSPLLHTRTKDSPTKNTPTDEDADRLPEMSSCCFQSVYEAQKEGAPSHGKQQEEEEEMASGQQVISKEEEMSNKSEDDETPRMKAKESSEPVTEADEAKHVEAIRKQFCQSVRERLSDKREALQLFDCWCDSLENQLARHPCLLAPFLERTSATTSLLFMGFTGDPKWVKKIIHKADKPPVKHYCDAFLQAFKQVVGVPVDTKILYRGLSRKYTLHSLGAVLFKRRVKRLRKSKRKVLAIDEFYKEVDEVFKETQEEVERLCDNTFGEGTKEDKEKK